MNPTFDDIDETILSTRRANWNSVPGPRVGDFVRLLDGTYRRFTHDWGDRIQVSTGNGDTGSFYFGMGYMDYSGGLNPGIPKANLVQTNDTDLGAAWFFHHDHHCAHNGVYFRIACRVFEEVEQAAAPGPTVDQVATSPAGWRSPEGVGLLKITKAAYEKIHPDFRGVWNRDDEPQYAQWVGRRTAMSGSLGLELGFLAIEGVNFEIVEDSVGWDDPRLAEHPIAKANRASWPSGPKRRKRR